MEDEDIDKIGLIGAQFFIEEQKQKIEEVKVATNCLEVNIKNKVAIIRKEAEEKIAAMSNRAVAVFYKDNDSIATIEEGIELSLVANSRPNYKISTPTVSRSEVNTSLTPIRPNTTL